MKNKKNLLIVVSLFVLNLFLIGILINSNNKIAILEKTVDYTIKPLNLKVKSNIENNEKKIVFSIDDTIGIFKDLTDNSKKYDSIFDNRILNYFKSLHDEYDFVVTFYVFYDFNHFLLSNTTDKFRNEFIENSNWLKFGFHAYDSKSNYEFSSYDESKSEYDKVLKELVRICGEESIDTFVRLHAFSGNIDSINAMKSSEYGITGLYTADDSRQNYYLEQQYNNLLLENDYIKKDELLWVHTDYRLEKIESFNDIITNLSDDDLLTVFTHEWLLEDSMILLKIKMFCDFAVINNYSFSFLDSVE